MLEQSRKKGIMQEDVIQMQDISDQRSSNVTENIRVVLTRVEDERNGVNEVLSKVDEQRTDATELKDSSEHFANKEKESPQEKEFKEKVVLQRKLVLKKS